MITLLNEQLYKDKNRTIYKTYCPNKMRYGLALHTSEGKKESMAEYKHVFNYFDNNKGVVVTCENQFKWIDTNLTVTPMSYDDENIVSCFHQHNSRCNCHGTSTECGVCRRGVLRNHGNFRKVESHTHPTYEYSTQLGAYRIVVIEEPSIRMGYDYLWRVCDFEERLQELIDSFEDVEKDCNTRNIKICLSEHAEEKGKNSVWLTGLYVQIEVIDFNISTIFTDDKIYLDLL